MMTRLRACTPSRYWGFLFRGRRSIEVVGLILGVLAIVFAIGRPDIEVHRHTFLRPVGPVQRVWRNADNRARRAVDFLLLDVQRHAAFENHEDLLIDVFVWLGSHTGMKQATTDDHVVAAEVTVDEAGPHLAGWDRLPIVARHRHRRLALVHAYLLIKSWIVCEYGPTCHALLHDLYFSVDDLCQHIRVLGDAIVALVEIVGATRAL